MQVWLWWSTALWLWLVFFYNDVRVLACGGSRMSRSPVRERQPAQGVQAILLRLALISSLIQAWQKAVGRHPISQYGDFYGDLIVQWVYAM